MGEQGSSPPDRPDRELIRRYIAEYQLVMKDWQDTDVIAARIRSWIRTRGLPPTDENASREAVRRLVVIVRQQLAQRKTEASSEVTAAREQPPREGFPRFWELFPIILPLAVRERVYEPAYQDLKEDYLRERARWPGGWARRYVTFCFTVRTVGLVVGSLWAAAGGKVRKAAITAVAAVFGEPLLAAIRAKLIEWLGRLP